MRRYAIGLVPTVASKDLTELGTREADFVSERVERPTAQQSGSRKTPTAVTT